MPLPQRVVGLTDATQRFGPRAERLASFYTKGDDLADEAVRSLAGLSRPDRTLLLQQCLREGADAIPSAPKALRSLFHSLEHVPFWVNADRCNRGGNAFIRTGVLGGLTLGFGALPASYCSAAGNKPLVLSGRLVTDTFPRLVETGKFVYAVSQPNALAPGGTGLEAVLKVRLIHAQVRTGLVRDPRWQEALWGTPISQADMAGTALLFSWVIAQGVRKLGGRFSPEDEADLLHLWRYAGYLLGVDEELLSATPDEARVLFALLEQLDAGPDDDSRRLVQALFEPKNFEERLKPLSLARNVRRIYQSLCRQFLGAERADAVGLPRTPVDLLIKSLPVVAWSAHTSASLLPFGNELLLAGGQAYWKRFIANGAPAT